MTDELKQWAEDKAADSARVKVLKEVYSELNERIKEYDNPNVYEIGVQTGLLMALVVIGNRILDIKGVPR